MNTPEINMIRKIAEEYLKIPVIFANQNYPRPHGNHIVIYLIDEKPVGFSEQDGNSFNKQFSIELCFDCVGENPYPIANTLTMLWELPTVREELGKNNVAWNKSFPLKNTTILFDQKYQQRLTFEASFSINKTITDKLEYIDEVTYGIN